jgi:hypothetical protein
MLKLTNIFEELNGVKAQLEEDKLYGRKVIDATTNRIGDSSEDTLNKLAIAGLFRDYFGNIQQLKSKEQLDSVFKKWYDGMLDKMVKTKAFAENRQNAKRYLDAYIGNVRELGDNAKRFSMKKIESGLVDLVNNNKWLESGIVSTKAGIYEPDEDDIVYEDDDILILDSRTKAKCVKYGSGESWCIGKPELNYYNTYRLNYGATPYHVLQKNVEGNEHKLVIMNYGSRGYAIADRSNTGNRHGGPNLAMSWDKVESEIPNLKGMQKYFPYREITAEERNYDSLLKRQYNNDNLQRYIEDMTRDLVVNDSSVTPEDFIRDYVAQNHSISDRQIESLTDSVKDSLIESGYFLSRGENQTDLLNDKQIRRIIRLKLENGKKLTEKEFEMVKGDEALMDVYKKSVKDKYNQFMEASSSWGRKRFELSYTELMTLDDGEISLYVQKMDKDLLIKFLLNNGLDKVEFLERYGVKDIFTDEQKEINKLIILGSKNNSEAIDRLNEMVPDGVDVDFYGDMIQFEGVDSDAISEETMYFLRRLSDDRWDEGYYDDYYDGRDDELKTDYENYLESALGDPEFREQIESYGIEPTIDAVDEVFTEKELKDDILNHISEVMNEASHEAKQEKWSDIVNRASNIITLEYSRGGYGYYGNRSSYDISMDVKAFILKGGYDLFDSESEDDFNTKLDFILDEFLDLYDDLPTNSDDIWEAVNDYDMAPDTRSIVDFIKNQADDIIEDDEMDYNEDDADTNSKQEIIQSLRDTLKGMKQPEMATKIENDLVEIEFDRQRFKMDGSVYVDMYDKKHDKHYDGFVKIKDIPAYFTNYKLFESKERIRFKFRGLL